MDKLSQPSHVSIETGGPNSGPEVLLTMTGSEESVLLSQFLVQTNIDLIVKARQGPAGSGPGGGGGAGGGGGPPTGHHPSSHQQQVRPLTFHHVKVL